MEREGDPEAVAVAPAEEEEGEHHEPDVEQREGQGQPGQRQHHGHGAAGAGVEHAGVRGARGQHAAEYHGAVHQPEADAGRCVGGQGKESGRPASRFVRAPQHTRPNYAPREEVTSLSGMCRMGWFADLMSASVRW